MIREVLSEGANAASNKDLNALSKLGFKGKIEDKNWLVGNATLPNIGDIEVHIELTQNPSSRGIKNGRIIYLLLVASGQNHANLAYYDGATAAGARREWLPNPKDPKEPEVKKFVAQIIKALS
jgi:hypothetical protein